MTWQLMLGTNLLWVAKQHGHSVEVMLRMYAAWLEGATEADIHAIKQAMEKRPATRIAIPDVRATNFGEIARMNRARLIVIRPPKSPEFGSSLPVGHARVTQVSETIRKMSGGEGGIRTHVDANRNQ